MVRASALPLEGHAQVGFCVEGLVHRCIAATSQFSYRPIPRAVGLHGRLTRRGCSGKVSFINENVTLCVRVDLISSRTDIRHVIEQL